MCPKELKEACGVAGIWGNPRASRLVYLCLYALQHRGQESAGIVSSDGVFHNERGMGLVSDVFGEERLARLTGPLAIGHVRYSTTGSSVIQNAQPLAVRCWRGHMALAHNGNLVNARRLRNALEGEGRIFRSTSDSELFVHLVAKSREQRLPDALTEALRQVQGAYSLTVMDESELIAVRDPLGFRPLCLGRLEDAYVVVSETCALDLLGATFEREIRPGEMVVIGEQGIESRQVAESPRQAQCIFEFIYFARPDSHIFGRSVYAVRTELGRQLARESAVEADTVIPIPDSGIFAAQGYSEQSGLPLVMGFIRNHYVGRTFIAPQQHIRQLAVRVKLNTVREAIEGQRVVVIDDSIVRGTTSRKLVGMLKSAGAREVHFRISSPPTKNSCFYGIDTPTRKELIANTHTLEEIRRYLEADSLAYLSLEGLKRCVTPDADQFCTACFSGDYPIPLENHEQSAERLF